MTVDEAMKLVASVPHWHDAFEIFPGVHTPGSYPPQFLWDKLQLPSDLTGMRVLDIGASDGFFSRELHARGAEVTSVDYRAKDAHGFGVMEKLYGHSFDYRQVNLYDLDAAGLGRFDLVLFLGVLYHLPDMMRGLAILHSVLRGSVYIETHYENEFCPNVSAARYYVDQTLNNDWTNFWAPNRLSVVDMLFDAGFDVVREEGWGSRLLVVAKANFEPRRLRKVKSAYGLLG